MALRKCEGRCGESFEDHDEVPPAETDGTVPKFLCFGCALSFGAHQIINDQPWPYVQTTLAVGNPEAGK